MVSKEHRIGQASFDDTGCISQHTCRTVVMDKEIETETRFAVILLNAALRKESPSEMENPV